MQIWLTILGMAAVTILTRLSGILALGEQTPVWVRRWMSYVPVSVFTALVVPALLVQPTAQGTGMHLVAGPPLLAGIAGAIAALRGGGVVLTIIVGLVVFWVLRIVIQW